MRASSFDLKLEKLRPNIVGADKKINSRNFDPK
jgi:hypothetical protein